MFFFFFILFFFYQKEILLQRLIKAEDQLTRANDENFIVNDTLNDTQLKLQAVREELDGALRDMQRQAHDEQRRAQEAVDDFVLLKTQLVCLICFD